MSLFISKSISVDMRHALDGLYELDPDFANIEELIPGLLERSFPATFASFVYIIIGQQISVSATAAIYGRLSSACELTPHNFLAASDDSLTIAGLSQSKLRYCRNLAEAFHRGQLDMTALALQDDEMIRKQLMSIPGIGAWSAQLFMLFALNRWDIFPVGDLAIRRSYALLKRLPKAPSINELIHITEPLSPYRSAAARLLWHLYRNRETYLATPVL